MAFSYITIPRSKEAELNTKDHYFPGSVVLNQEVNTKRQSYVDMNLKGTTQTPFQTQTMNQIQPVDLSGVRLNKEGGGGVGGGQPENWNV